MKAMIAISKNVIGNGNGLPWKNKEDLSRFALQTKDKNLVMGYNTFMSLPEIDGVKLKGRTLHVLINEGTNIELPDYVIGITLDVLKDYHCCGLTNDYICIGGMKTLNLLYDEGLISEADITWMFGTGKMNLDNPVYFEGSFAKRIQESAPYSYDVQDYKTCTNIIETYQLLDD